MPTVAFQGVRGAYSESAIYQFFGPEAKPYSCKSLEKIFEAVETGQSEMGMLPVENALSGSIPHAYELLMEDVESGFVVGPSVVEGVVCDHLAFSKPGTDFQVWIARSEQPLPMKLVITSRDVMNAPQFSVVLREWDLASEFSDEKFAFEPPGDAQAIEFTVLEPESD